jgi:hypothetical protein
VCPAAAVDTINSMVEKQRNHRPAPIGGIPGAVSMLRGNHPRPSLERTSRVAPVKLGTVQKQNARHFVLIACAIRK